eukprot:CAMPEP_0113469394 /NCGR_PEP_ID=MMETSP0014_2-20120614/15875_1 /TAXON_ID=2857 /ORGANISM="Nitzschia sp." /LENGTH=788 /DNA_ID=CAMNT_0000361867 /DNA_START=146 /DNA_END=2512 /DNA_ORIENTATION=- /assembly_acc=CAM_ASM_000159
MASASITVTKEELNEPRARAALRMARRVVVKAGTSVVANEDGSPSLRRLGAIVEQIAELNQAGKEILFVSSGAVGMGRNLLRKQARLNMSFMDLHKTNPPGKHLEPQADEISSRLTPQTSIADLLEVNEQMQTSAAKSYAAAGQFELMNLYQSLFAPKNVTCSQMLLTQADFQNESHLKTLTYATERLLSLGVVPIINENDAVSIMGDDMEAIFSDNDSLAALCARTFGAEVLLLLTDVDGVYNIPPSNPKARLINFYHSNSEASIGEKSSLGRGGMGAKIAAAEMAVAPGSACTACVVAAGSDLDSVRSILSTEHKPEFGPPKGTLFATPGSDLEKQALEELVNWETDDETVTEAAREMATAARKEARKLQSMPFVVRKSILNAVADALVERQDELVEANKLDLAYADTASVAAPLVARLKLTPEKLATLAKGIRQLADQQDPLGVVKNKRELADGLELSFITVPIGVLMVIFESRPDSLPQIASLALASGNGLLLKGGKEAVNSNAALHEIIGDAIEKASNGEISREIIALVTSRGQVKDMLSLDDVIDLVIPRGSNSLVSYIKANTRIPVLGHADGVCHVYVDSSADAENASKIVVDAKADYPSACNAMETLLLHEDTVENGVALQVMMALRSVGVKCLGGPKAMKAGLSDVPAKEMKCEYGDLTCLVEIVDSLDTAIEWIHEHGSGHTEAIVCADDSPAGEEFLRKVDAACVFKNASTRFADGFRLGLGAEVGISTGRIHARGPVGVEGLLTTKWQLRSSSGISYVAEFAGDNPAKTYTHRELM